MKPDDLIRRLRRVPGLVVREARMDAVRLQVAGSPGALVRVLELPWFRTPADVERAAAAAQTRGQEHTLLVVPRLSPEARDGAAERGLSWYERSTGVLHIELPGIFVHEQATDMPSRRSTVAPQARVTKLAGLAGRCAESLVLFSHDADGSPITTSQLAEMSEVTVPQAAHVLTRLEGAGVVERAAASGRARAWRVTNAVQLLELWATEERARATEFRLYIWSRTAEELLTSLRALDQHVEAWALGGAAAANLYAPTLLVQPTPAVWIPNDVAIETISGALDTRPESQSPNLVVRQATRDPWRTHTAPFSLPRSADRIALPLTSRPRAYVECLQDASGRTQELAAALARQLALFAAV